MPRPGPYSRSGVEILRVARGPLLAPLAAVTHLRGASSLCARIARPLCIVCCAWMAGVAPAVADPPKFEPVVKRLKAAALVKARTYVWTERHAAYDTDADARIVA